MAEGKIICLCGEVGYMIEGDDPDPCPKCGRKYDFQLDHIGKHYVIKFPKEKNEESKTK